MTISLKQAKALGIDPGKAPSRLRKAAGERVDQSVGRSVFVAQAKAYGLPEPIPEYRFDPSRQWRIDWAFVCAKNLKSGFVRVALEIEGGIWSGGRHVRGKGFLGDMEKYNEAAILGWRVLRVTPQQVESGEAFALVARAIKECQ